MSPTDTQSDNIEGALRGRFGRFDLDAAFDLPAKGITAIIGASGSGKTTLLRCIAGLERARGRLVVRGETWQDDRVFLPPHRRGVGYVFQDAALFPHLSLRANLRYGMDRAGRGEGLAFDAVVGLLGLGGLLTRGVEKLSGGERQRGAIARALLARPRLLLLDEPTASLDGASKAELLPYLERLHTELALPVIYVSHDVLEVERLADRVLHMQAGRLSPVATGEARAAALARTQSLDTETLRRLAASALLAGLE